MAPRQIIHKKLKDGSWQICFYTNGRGSKRIKRKFALQKDALIWINEYEGNSHNSPLEKQATQRENINLRTEYELWKTHNKNHVSPSHFKRCEGMMNSILDYFKLQNINEFQITDMALFQQFLLDKGLANNTVNRNTELIKAIINHSVRLGRLQSNPFEHARKLPPIKKKETDYWSDEEAGSFLAYAKNRYENIPSKQWIYTAYLVCINTGLRGGELWGIKVSDIRPDRIIISRQFERTTRMLAPLKSKRTASQQFKIVPLNPYVKNELDAHIKRNSLHPDSLLFQNSKGGGIWHDSFVDMYHRDLERWGGKGIRMHDLRTTYITQLISNGFDLRTVMEIAGHTDIKTTIGYAKMVGRNIEKVSQGFSILPDSGSTSVTPS